jgi:hypothetical protein
MFTTSEAHHATSHRRVVYRSLGYDYALLGLPAGEARVEVIREAAVQTASRIQQAAGDPLETTWMLSDLASSTYRLLDPRRRAKMIERVKLSLYSETDLELQKDARRPLLAKHPASPPKLVTRERRHPPTVRPNRRDGTAINSLRPA